MRIVLALLVASIIVGVDAGQTLILLSQATASAEGFSAFRQGDGHASFLTNDSDRQAVAFRLQGKAGAEYGQRDEWGYRHGCLRRCRGISFPRLGFYQYLIGRSELRAADCRGTDRLESVDR